VSVWLIGGKDDAQHEIDENTLVIQPDVRDGGLWKVKGRISQRFGAGEAYAKLNGTLWFHRKPNDEISGGPTTSNTEESLKVYILPANSFNKSDNAIKVEAWGKQNSGSPGRKVRIRFDQNDRNLQAAEADIDTSEGHWKVEALIYRHGADPECLVGFGNASTAHGITREALVVDQPEDYYADKKEIAITGEGKGLSCQCLLVRTLNQFGM
jgi:hypothetical protein